MKMTSVADALGAVTRYHYNKRDQLVEEKNRETLRTQGRLYAKRDYNPLSCVVQMHSGYFDPEGQMQALGVSFNTRPLVSKQFSYDLNGELTQAEDVFNGIQHYAYDALGLAMPPSGSSSLSGTAGTIAAWLDTTFPELNPLNWFEETLKEPVRFEE